MTDRISSITIALDHDIRDDDIEPLLTALRMMRFVVKIEPNVAGHESFTAESRSEMAWQRALIRLCKEGPSDEDRKL